MSDKQDASSEEAGMPQHDLRTCFVISPIGEAGSDVRKRSDIVLKHIIQPVVLECGYGPAVRADQLALPGIITRQVIDRVVNDDLVIADLTGANANVFYELAIRHMVRKPVVQLVASVDDIPFDIAQSRTIEVNHSDLESVEAAKSELQKQIVSSASESWVGDNPISMALDHNALLQADDPIKRSIAELLSASSDLKKAVRAIELETYDGFRSMTDAIGQVWRAMDDIDPASHVLHTNDDVMSKLEDIESAIDKQAGD